VFSITLWWVARVKAALTDSSRSWRSADSWSNLVFKVSKVGWMYGLSPLQRYICSSGERASRNIDGSDACHSLAS
jgi:hypothetical protein